MIDHSAARINLSPLVFFRIHSGYLHQNFMLFLFPSHVAVWSGNRFVSQRNRIPYAMSPHINAQNSTFGEMIKIELRPTYLSTHSPDLWNNLILNADLDSHQILRLLFLGKALRKYCLVVWEIRLLSHEDVNKFLFKKLILTWRFDCGPGHHY